MGLAQAPLRASPPTILRSGRTDVMDGMEPVQFPTGRADHGRVNGAIRPVAVPCTRILVADDHEVVRCGLRTVLETRAGWKIVAEATDGKSAVAQAVKLRPEIAIVDDLIPLMDGIEVTRRIRAGSPGTQVLAFGTHENEAWVRGFLRAGGRAYVLKSDAANNLVAAVEALVRRRPFFTGTISEALLEVFLSTGERSSAPALTARERAVVRLIAEGCSNKRIGDVLNLSIKTVEAHRAAAMRKINGRSTAELVRYAVRNGLVEV